jgi:hypothetical protein
MYAQVVGVVLLLLGIVGLFVGTGAGANYLWDGGLNSHIIEDIIHLVIGLVLVYVGFMAVDAATLRMVVGVIGIVLLLVAILGFIDARLFGIFNDAPYTMVDNVVHLILGLAAVAVAYLLPAPTDTTTTRTTM